MIDADYSSYTLPQLFKARYWAETPSAALEAEIAKRCAHIRERTNGERSAAATSSARFTPYGLIFGGALLSISVGPFVAVKLLDKIKLINDVNGDHGDLSGMWALLTLPLMVIVFLIGSMMDAERIGTWCNLDDRS